MIIKTTVTRDMFIHNSTLKDYFSYDARSALFQHLEGLEYLSDTELVFDANQIIRQYTEYADINSVIMTYFDTADPNFTEHENWLEYFTDQTTVIDTSSSLIVKEFN